MGQEGGAHATDADTGAPAPPGGAGGQGSTCLLIRKAPYGASNAAETFRALQAFYAFEKPVTLLFMDDAVLSLVRGVDPAGIGMRPLSRAFADLGALPGVGFVVHLESLEERGLRPDDLEPPLEGADAFRFVRTADLEATLASHKAIIRV